MGFVKDLPLYKKSDLRYLCMRLIPITSLGDFHYGSLYCPFHHNVNTPAASLFKDSDGIERIYCYSCKRQFTSYDYIVEVLEQDPVKRLLKICTKQELDEMLKNKVDVYAQKTAKLVFKDVETLLTDLYNFDLALSPKQN